MAVPRTVQWEIMQRIKSLDKEERYYVKRREELLTEAAALQRLADDKATMRRLYEILLRDSMGIQIVVPDAPPPASGTNGVEIKVRRGSSVIAPLG